MPYFNTVENVLGSADDALSSDGSLNIGWVEVSKEIETRLPSALDKAECFIRSELNWCDIEVRKHQSGHTRTTSTEALLNAYSCQLRDYVQNGAIATNKPVRPD